jgi:hypothetical protein
MNEDVEITLRFPEDLYNKLLQTANLSDQSIQDVVRVLLAIVVLEGVENDSIDA